MPDKLTNQITNHSNPTTVIESLNLEHTAETPIEKESKCLFLSGYVYGFAYNKEKPLTEHDRKMLLECAYLLFEYSAKIEQKRNENMHKKIKGKPHFFSD